VYEQQRLVYSTECPGPLELGRQKEGEGEPFRVTETGGRRRVVLARLGETGVPRNYVLAEPLADDRVRLTNLNPRQAVRFPDGSVLAPRASRDVTLPVVLRLGPRLVRIETAGAGPAAGAGPDEGSLQSLAEPPQPPGARAASFSGAAAGKTVAPAGQRPPTVVGLSAEPGMPGIELVGWLQTVLDVLQSAASSRDFFERAAGALVERVGLDAGRVLLLDRGQWHLEAQQTAPQWTARDWQPSRRVLDQLLREKRTFWLEPTGEDLTGNLTGVASVLAAPILSPEGEVIGALYGDRGLAGNALGAGPISRLEAMLVQLLAEGVAAGLARLEQERAKLASEKKLLLVERDLEIGRELQAGFVPAELPQPPGWEVAAHFRPALKVGGDFYDAFALPGDHLVLVIADVCDKGVGSALYMAMFRSLLRAFAQQGLGRGILGWPGQQPAPQPPPVAPEPPAAGQRRATLLADLIALSTVERTNNYVAATHRLSAMYATLFVGVLDVRTGAMTYVNAAHPAPVLLGPAGVKERLDSTGPAAGQWPNFAYDINRTRLEPGDMFLAYTDGVTDARDAAGRFYTRDRLLTVLARPVASAAALLGAVVQDVTSHVAGAEPFDDVTLLAVRRTS
jgi:sigma-B regulation protein RsbU (phosphoserine phosphatase)